MTTLLLVLSLLGNLAWLTATLHRWWRHASTAQHHIAAATAAIYIGLWLVVRVAAGSLAAWTLALASLGLPAVIASVLAITGYSAAHHARREADAIAAIEADRRAARKALPR